MKIQYCSDLHLEFPENKSFLEASPLTPAGDVLVLAGDIVPFAIMDRHDDFFDYVADHYERCWWIPGNHEYYNSDASKRSGTFTEKIRKNVTLLNNISVVYNNTRFLFSTLWTHIGLLHQWQIEHSLTDFRVITYNGERLNASRYNILHRECLDFLETELNKPFEGKTVVVTHHVPTLQNYPPQFKGDVINEAFAVELEELIEKTVPDCWIYGHLHSAMPSFTVGNTLMLSNQLGYLRYQEGGEFRLDSVTEGLA